MLHKQLFLASLLAILALPISVKAFTGDGDLIRLANNTWVYTETITLGAEANAFKVPIIAVPSWTPRVSGDYLKYQISLNDRPFAGLDTSALVLSTAKIEDTTYVVEAGETAEFTLFSIISLQSDVVTSPDLTLDFEVTSFPLTGVWSSNFSINEAE
jgi:hypothetical protein